MPGRFLPLGFSVSRFRAAVDRELQPRPNNGMLNPPDKDTCLLLLIRHGATDANLQRPYVLQGRTLNGPLSTTGEDQVSRASRFLESLPVQRVFASPLLRAQQSAAVIAQPHGLPVGTIEEISEIDVGEWESKSWEVIQQIDPDSYAEFIANPADVPYKGGESYRHVSERVVPAIKTLAAQHMGEMIVVVAHNVVNRAILAETLQLDLRVANKIKQHNACINVLKFHDGQLELITLNGMFHLGQV